MTPRSTWQVLRKDLRLGPRSPIFLFALVMPFLITFLLAAVFGNLLAPTPSLAVVDGGDSRVMDGLLALEGVEVSVLDDEAVLRDRVEAHDVDAGLVLPAGFDAALAAGDRPDLEFLVAGSSLASTRVLLAVVALDAIEEVAGTGPEVAVTLTRVGSEDFVPVGDRLVPFMVLYAVVVAGLFVPAASLLEEREQGTLDAVLVSPARIGDVFAAKGTLAALLATAMGLVTLALNQAFAGQVLALTLGLLVGSVMMAEIGLVLGAWARDSNTMFSAVKAGGIVIMLPAVFALFPALPQWIPRLTPTYYFIDPLYRLAILGDDLGDAAGDLAVAAALCVALLPIVVWSARGAERRAALV